MQDKEYIQEDEIDLRELFITIWNKKLFIVAFTSIVTILSIIYAYSKTPIYEVKSVIRIGYIGQELLEKSNVLEKKLRVIFNVDEKQVQNKKEVENFSYVSDIKSVKKVDDFLSISTQAFSNEKALDKNKEVLSFLQDEYKNKIEQYLNKTNINIKNLRKKIDYSEKIEKAKLEYEIKKLKTQNLAKIDEKIKLIKEQELPFLYSKIKYNKTLLSSLDKKIEFNEKKLNEYEKSILKISNLIYKDNTKNMIMSLQLLNTQNLVLNLQNKIEDLKLKKEDISNEKFTKIKTQIKNLKEIKLKDLEIQKQNLRDENIKRLEIKLNVDLVNKIANLKDKIIEEKYKISKDNIQNSKIVGEYIVNDSPIKPNKKLIVVVAFVTAFILAIFLVFFMQFLKGFQKEEDK
ncbi:MAG: hypothetical protein GY932_00875 [Arcobacter sp.]|nr:hypothetical protein [Arcobacter sp.]